MRVTLDVILEETEYAPTPGTEYELAEDVRVKLKRPYIDLQEEFEDLEEELDQGFVEARRKARKLQKKRKEADDEDPISEQELKELRSILKTIQRERRKADAQLAKLVTKGEWPERYLGRVASQIVQDFRKASTPTASGLMN